jgi:GcrA cell cycle regulator
MISFWTQTKEKILKAMWGKGSSAREIGDKVGATRNAVIGKARRLELEARVPENFVTKTKKAPVKKVAPPPPPPPRSTTPGVKYLSRGSASDLLMSLSADNCRWPDGHPSGDDFTFCAGKKQGSSPYCKIHSEIAYTPATRKLR